MIPTRCVPTLKGRMSAAALEGSQEMVKPAPVNIILSFISTVWYFSHIKLNSDVTKTR